MMSDQSATFASEDGLDLLDQSVTIALLRMAKRSAQQSNSLGDDTCTHTCQTPCLLSSDAISSTRAPVLDSLCPSALSSSTCTHSPASPIDSSPMTSSTTTTSPSSSPSSFIEPEAPSALLSSQSQSITSHRHSPILADVSSSQSTNYASCSTILHTYSDPQSALLEHYQQFLSSHINSPHPIQLTTFRPRSISPGVFSPPPSTSAFDSRSSLDTSPTSDLDTANCSNQSFPPQSLRSVTVTNINSQCHYNTMPSSSHLSNLSAIHPSLTTNSPPQRSTIEGYTNIVSKTDAANDTQA